MRSKLFAMTALTPSRTVPLAAQSREEPVAVFAAGENDEWGTFLLVLHRSIEDGHLLATRLVASSQPPFSARRKPVAQANVGKGAAHHDLVVAAAPSRRS